MRKGFVLAACLLLLLVAGSAAADQEVVKASFGTMSLSGNLQVGFNWFIGNESLGSGLDENGQPAPQAKDGASDMEFYLKRVRLVFAGEVVSEKIKYMVQLEAKDETGVVLADVKLGFKYIPYTTIWVGRFLPHFQYWTPIHTGRLYLIEYPLAYQFFGVQRHTGLEIAFNHKYVDMFLGLNNGHNYNRMAQLVSPNDRTLVNSAGDPTLGNQTWNEENTGKDIYFTIDGKPVDNMHIHAGVWYGTPVDYFENDEGEMIEHNASFLGLNGGFEYDPNAGPVAGLRVSAEVFSSTLNYDDEEIVNGDLTDRVEGNTAMDYKDLKSLAYYLRLGYNLEAVTGVPVEFLVQYDYLNPDTEDDKDTHGYQDELTWITGGVNYYIEDYHAMIYLNYIHKREAIEDVLNLKGDDTQKGINNDILQVLWQVAF